MLEKELEEYWRIFDDRVKRAPVLTQRKVALAYCELVASLLDSEGRKALIVIRELAEGKVTERRRAIWHKKVQTLLNKELGRRDAATPLSVLAWSLMSDNPSYPPYYAAGIAGLNVVDLQVATHSKLTAVALDVIASHSA